MHKDQRTKIHDSVKKAFGKKIFSSTITKDDKKFIVFATFSKEGNKCVYLYVHLDDSKQVLVLRDFFNSGRANKRYLYVVNY